MATNPVSTPPAITELQTAIRGLEQIGGAAAAPFIKSEEGKATEQKVLGELNLAVAALPFFGNILQGFAQAAHSLGSLFHHAHKMMAPPPPPPDPGESDPAGDSAE